MAVRAFKSRAKPKWLPFLGITRDSFSYLLHNVRDSLDVGTILHVPALYWHKDDGPLPARTTWTTRPSLTGSTSKLRHLILRTAVLVPPSCTRPGRGAGKGSTSLGPSRRRTGPPWCTWRTIRGSRWRSPWSSISGSPLPGPSWSSHDACHSACTMWRWHTACKQFLPHAPHRYHMIACCLTQHLPKCFWSFIACSLTQLLHYIDFMHVVLMFLLRIILRHILYTFSLAVLANFSHNFSIQSFHLQLQVMQGSAQPDTAITTCLQVCPETSL